MPNAVFHICLHSVGVWESSVGADLILPWKKKKRKKKKKHLSRCHPTKMVSFAILKNKNNCEQSNSAVWEVHVNADCVI